MTNEFARQAVSASLILIGSIKLILGFFITKKAYEKGDFGLAPSRRSLTFRILLGLTKSTSDAPLYLFLGVMTAASHEPIALWALIWIVYCAAINVGGFIRWAEDQGEEVDA